MLCPLLWLSTAKVKGEKGLGVGGAGPLARQADRVGPYQGTKSTNELVGEKRAGAQEVWQGGDGYLHSPILLLSLQGPISTTALICNSKGLLSDETAG